MCRWQPRQQVTSRSCVVGVHVTLLTMSSKLSYDVWPNRHRSVIWRCRPVDRKEVQKNMLRGTGISKTGSAKTEVTWNNLEHYIRLHKKPEVVLVLFSVTLFRFPVFVSNGMRLHYVILRAFWPRAFNQLQRFTVSIKFNNSYTDKVDWFKLTGLGDNQQYHILILYSM